MPQEIHSAFISLKLLISNKLPHPQEPWAEICTLFFFLFFFYTEKLKNEIFLLLFRGKKLVVLGRKRFYTSKSYVISAPSSATLSARAHQCVSDGGWVGFPSTSHGTCYRAVSVGSGRGRGDHKPCQYTY